MKFPWLGLLTAVILLYGQSLAVLGQSLEKAAGESKFAGQPVSQAIDGVYGGEFFTGEQKGSGAFQDLPQVVTETPSGLWAWEEWDNSIELGINGGAGNSETLNISGGLDLEHSDSIHEAKIGLKWVNNTSNSTLVARNVRFSIDWEKKFGELMDRPLEASRWSWFIKNTYYYDDFRPFDLRAAVNSGAGLKFYENKIRMLKGRIGAGVSREFGGAADHWIPEALIGLDYRRQLSKRQKLEATFDYYPSWEDFSDYRLVMDGSWVFLLDEETNLSLKLNVNDRYDSTPDGASANDVFYSLLALWEF
ncbi:MAG: DUF481 domain-containing protein [Planctomycetota bacterium]|nr:DUF481 domain-containing protein [Planctomycetota bacterium]